jgi:hypothetical protein
MNTHALSQVLPQFLSWRADDAGAVTALTGSDAAFGQHLSRE